MKEVLLIEDEPHIVEALSFLLTREGLNVTVHSDGGNAIERISSLRPDLVILDQMLPNKSGMDILIDIRNASELGHLPVLMLTAKGQSKDRAAAESAGVSLFMTKPFSNQEVIDNVRTLVA